MLKQNQNQNQSNSISNQRLQQLIAEARARAATIPTPEHSEAHKHENNATQQDQNFSWNPQQQTAINLIASGKSCIIVGSAGTGKTTLVKEGVRLLSQKSSVSILTEWNETDCLKEGMPAIVACSYTRTAVANIARAINNAVNTATIHKLIEFKPMFYEEFDEATGESKTKRIFEPTRNADNPLPAALHTIIIEEAGIVNIRLFNQLLDAINPASPVQIIMLGDLFQLDPPYDPAILGYAMDVLPVIELTHVYRQALSSPILKFAVDIKDGKTWGSQHFAELSRECSDTQSTLSIKPWKHRLDSFKATAEAAKFIEKEYNAGRYVPERSSIITPFGAAANSKDKEAAFGSLNLNRYIADFLGKKRNAVVHEVIAGFNKLYLAEGDHVVYQKQRGIITAIKKNYAYLGKVTPQPASVNLDRWGGNCSASGTSALDLEAASPDEDAEFDRLLLAASADSETAFRNASHTVTVKLEDSREELELSNSGDFNPQTFDFSYAQTCYKAQGGEWDIVYVFAHKSHSAMLCNEFFYTACTRARKSLTLVCEPDHLMNAVKRQAVPGRSWKEKLQHFQHPKKKESLLPFGNLLQWLHDRKQELKAAEAQGEMF